MLQTGQKPTAPGLRGAIDADRQWRHREAVGQGVGDLTDRFMSESDPLEAHRKDVLWFLEHKWTRSRSTSLFTGLSGMRATKHGLWIPFWKGDDVVDEVRGWSSVKTAMKGSSFTTGLWSPFSEPNTTKTTCCAGAGRYAGPVAAPATRSGTCRSWSLACRPVRSS